MSYLKIKNLSILDIKKTTFDSHDILDFLKILDNDFFPSLSSRIDLNLWSEKLYKKSLIFIAFDSVNRKIVAILCFYCNDLENYYSYIPMLGVLKPYRRLGLIKLIFDKCFKYLKKNNFKTLGIKTWNNSIALTVYKSLGFEKISEVNDRPNNGFTIYLEKKIN